MPVKYDWISVDLLMSTADSLKKAAEQFTQVVFEMQQSGMDRALFPWTQRQWDCHDAIVTLANQCVAVLPAQRIAKAQNRKSQFEIMQDRSKRDTEKRHAKKATVVDPNAIPRKRGRPRKVVEPE